MLPARAARAVQVDEARSSSDIRSIVAAAYARSKYSIAFGVRRVHGWASPTRKHASCSRQLSRIRTCLLPRSPRGGRWPRRRRSRSLDSPAGLAAGPSTRAASIRGGERTLGCADAVRCVTCARRASTRCTSRSSTLRVWRARRSIVRARVRNPCRHLSKRPSPPSSAGSEQGARLLAERACGAAAPSAGARLAAGQAGTAVASCAAIMVATARARQRVRARGAVRRRGRRCSVEPEQRGHDRAVDPRRAAAAATTLIWPVRQQRAVALSASRAIGPDPREHVVVVAVRHHRKELFAAAHPEDQAGGVEHASRARQQAGQLRRATSCVRWRCRPSAAAARSSGIVTRVRSPARGCGASAAQRHRCVTKLGTVSSGGAIARAAPPPADARGARRRSSRAARRRRAPSTPGRQGGALGRRMRLLRGAAGAQIARDCIQRLVPVAEDERRRPSVRARAAGSLARAHRRHDRGERSAMFCWSEPASGDREAFARLRMSLESVWMSASRRARTTARRAARAPHKPAGRCRCRHRALHAIEAPARSPVQRGRDR